MPVSVAAYQASYPPKRMGVVLPQGVVTFLFTDIEGSTRLWDEAPQKMMDALNQHDEAIDRAIEAHDGVSVKPRGEGDSRFVVFSNAADAVAAVSQMQVELDQVDWVTPRPIKVRASLHTGSADLQLGDYYGSTVNRAARLRAIAHGGQTVISGATWGLVQDELVDGVTVTDMGEHALKDLTRPEHVFQLNPPGLPTDFPPLASLDAVDNNLPQQVTEFVGRDHELQQAKELIDQTRMLTILAPGGTGKTRLAIQAAADLISDYPDGVFFISLAEVSDLDGVIQTIAESLGVAFSADEEPKVQLLNYLSNKTQLLVFDNFEHVVDSAGVISEILHATAGVKLIVTSRAKLNVQGELVMQLGGLEVSWDNEHEALAASGVRLFLDAAKRSDPGFALDTDSLDPLETILNSTGGMPLGILLAAAWVDVLPIHEIAAEITKSLDFLETQMGDVPDRHRSIRAVFDYSWELLTEAERDVFAALSIFRSGFTRPAAEEVAGAGLRDLAMLTGKSLISPNATKDRYSVHELLRQFAEDELRSKGKHLEIRAKHAEYFGKRGVATLSELLVGSQAEIITEMEADRDNSREAWRTALDDKNPNLARQLLNPLLFLYEIRGWYRPGATLWADAAAAFPEYGDDDDANALRAMAISAHAYFRTLLGQPDAEPVMEAAEVLRRSGTAEETWLALQGAALASSYLGDLPPMIEVTDEMIEIGSALDEGVMVVGGYNWRTLAALMEDDLEFAREKIVIPAEYLEARGEIYYRTWTLALQSMVAMADGDQQQAVDLLAEQVAISRQIGYRRGVMTGLGSLAQALSAIGDLPEAERTLINAIEVADEMGVVSEILSFMVGVAGVMASDRPVAAVELLSTVIAEPASAGQTISNVVPVVEQANDLLDELRSQLGDDEFEAALERAKTVPYETAAKQLIDSLH